ncbi:phage holin family protein [Luteolibacter algae]|uniref:Phage holin family protein n=1 Tax=Luteolibacter algae TaxID=454151 RepID=A0ABW5D6Y2_9BACT
MSNDSVTSQSHPPDLEDHSFHSSDGIPTNWKEALACLISSRLAIFQVESRQAAQTGVSKIIFLSIAGIAILFSWILLMAGAVGGIASVTALAWYHAAFIIAGIHILVAVIMILLGGRKTAPSFPLTRAEFDKDREWLNQLKKQ